MIYFTIPSSSGLVGVNTDIFIDRDPTAQSELNLLSFKGTNEAFTQYRSNGINVRNEQLTVTIKNITNTRALLIDSYFRLLKTGNLAVIFPEGTKNYHVVGWNITLKNSLYADIVINLELMYL